MSLTTCCLILILRRALYKLQGSSGGVTFRAQGSIEFGFDPSVDRGAGNLPVIIARRALGSKCVMAGEVMTVVAVVSMVIALVTVLAS